MIRPSCFRLAILFAAFAGILTRPALHAKPLNLDPFNKSGIYSVGENVGWYVTLPTDAEAPAVAYNYTIKKNNSVIIASGKCDLTSPSASISVVINEPAMLHLEVSPAEGSDKPQVAAAAVDPTQLQPSAPCPADFDVFWAAKIELLRAIPADPVVTVGESEKAGVDYASVTLTNIYGSHVYGQIAKPAGKGKFPAMLVLQWAGGPYPLQKSWVTDRAAEGWLAMNIEPHDVPGNLPPEFYAALPQLIKGYNTIYNDDRDRNYFLQMYLGAYRAIDYLASRPDWNGEVLVATGTSMGGQQTLAVAGLHPKVTHMMVHVPAGADSNGVLHGRSSSYPFWDGNNPKVMETGLYFDTVNFASRIKAKCLVSMGFIDTICPATGIWTAFNQIRAPKEVVPLVEAAHNHQATAEQQRAYTDRLNEWLSVLVKSGEPKLKEFTPATLASRLP